MPRKTNAIIIPIKRTNCSFDFAIFNLAKIIMKMKRLSMDSEYSVIHPAKNSDCAFEVLHCPIEIPKIIAAQT
jgi:hypothetical protein